MSNNGGDPMGEALLGRLVDKGITTVHERHQDQQPRCGFGELGLCCRHCFMGPCRIDPFGEGPQVGVCGAGADTIAARSFLRAVAAGCSAHSEHGRDVAHSFLLAAQGKAPGYAIRDEAKLLSLAGELGVETKGRPIKDVAVDVGRKALDEFGKPQGVQLLLQRAPARRRQRWQSQGLEPRAIDREVVEAMHRSSVGVDQDFRNIMRQASRCALADGWGGSMLSTELQDVLFGTPEPIKAEVGLGVLDPKQVNLVLHGHEPLLAEMVVEASRDPELLELARELGAEGINLAGICCTANEMLMRRGVPVAGNFLQQELAIATGVVDGMIVDVQCVMQALVKVAAGFHTLLMTTSDQARIAGAVHLPFDHADAPEAARQLVRRAVENFTNRADEPLVPNERTELVAGFTHESVRNMLGGAFRASYVPLNDNIINGRILGVAGVVGCGNPRAPGQEQTVELVRELIANDVLVLQTGCQAVSSARQGLALPEAALEHAGPGLREVCETVGIPPVLHCGSCVDNSRLLVAASGMVAAGGLGDDISDLPLAGAAPGWMSEKAMTIGQYFVASGVHTVFGLGLPVQGAKAFTDYLTGGIADDLGGSWAIELEPGKIAGRMMDHMVSRREALGIHVQQERKLFDMKERREL